MRELLFDGRRDANIHGCVGSYHRFAVQHFSQSSTFIEFAMLHYRLMIFLRPRLSRFLACRSCSSGDKVRRSALLASEMAVLIYYRTVCVLTDGYACLLGLDHLFLPLRASFDMDTDER